ncbi:MAG: YdcF family protein [Bacteroidetes bacterium]|nr:YdcF family protein [Bacteroidota bacterium]
MIGRKIKIVLVLVIIAIITTILGYWVIKNRAVPFLYSSVEQIPAKNVGLILGTSPYLGNQYFKNRIDAAVLLFNSGKIKCIIVSGDNHVEGYDEPTAMKKKLLARGIPDSCIILDYAGFRTLDSIIRCKEVFGQNEFTIISQQFHNERALFIAHHYGIEAIAFNAQDVNKNYGLKTALREYLARMKCIIDLYLLNTQPHFLGEKIILNN